MKSRTHLARVAVTAVLVFAMGCRSYFLADEPSDAGGGNAEVGAADASVTAKARRIYVYGGSPDGVTLPEEPMAHYAEILPDGLLGPWRAAPKPPTSMIWHSSAQGRDFIALLSGIARPHGGNLKIFVGSVADGAVTSFVTSPDLFPNPIHHGASLIRGDVLYVMGGQIGDDKPPTADVWRSAITATTFAPPVRVTPLPAPVARMAMAEGAGSVFLVGGTDQNNANTTSILRARFQVDGSLSTFEPQPPCIEAHSWSSEGKRSKRSTTCSPARSTPPGTWRHASRRPPFRSHAHAIARSSTMGGSMSWEDVPSPGARMSSSAT